MDREEPTGASDPENGEPSKTGIYGPSPAKGALQQGDIVGALTQWVFVTLEDNEPVFEKQPHPYSVVLSQSCDLEWDHEERSNGRSDSGRCLSSILLAPAYLASDVRERKAEINADRWNRIKRNNEERFHFFQAVPTHEDATGEGVPELVVDFKRYFSLPAAEIYIQLESTARRRVRLVSPYLEHVATRFFYFQSRVATPTPHFSTP